MVDIGMVGMAIDGMIVLAGLCSVLVILRSTLRYGPGVLALRKAVAALDRTEHTGRRANPAPPSSRGLARPHFNRAGADRRPVLSRPAPLPRAA